uniref:Uncharacterized protein n=1 Tax=Trichuris muris TaxID=70415 RepID=A0A5S6QYF1_TRIMR
MHPESPLLRKANLLKRRVGCISQASLKYLANRLPSFEAAEVRMGDQSRPDLMAKVKEDGLAVGKPTNSDAVCAKGASS